MADGILDMKKYATVIGALAVVVLIIMAIVLGFSKQVRTETTLINETITLGVVGVPATLGTSYPFPQTLTTCVNDSAVTNSLDSSFYSINEGATASAGGTVTLNILGTEWNSTDINCTMKYLADSDGSAVGDKFITGITIFATFAGVLILAIIGMLIVRLYKKD